MNETLTDVFVAVGSNIEPYDNIPRALLGMKIYLTITAISNFYETPAAGRPDQPNFLNGVVKIQTARVARQLKFDILRNIEDRLGRVRSEDKYAARTIDLDVILYGCSVIDEPDLKLPDPAFRSYPFVAVPLFELAPDLTLPDTGKRLSDEPIIKQTAELKPLPDFTDYLRRLILVDFVW